MDSISKCLEAYIKSRKSDGGSQRVRNRPGPNLSGLRRIPRIRPTGDQRRVQRVGGLPLYTTPG